MLIKIFGFILGIFLSALGLTFIIVYFNLLNMEYSFLDYVNFIIRRIECWLIILGVVLICVSLRKGRKII